MREAKMKKYLGILFYFVIVVFCVLFVGDLVSYKLVYGARWSSGLPLGGVDNWLNEGGSLYTIPENGYTPGSSYFPGIVLLALLYRVLFGYGAETAIIITGGIVALLASWGFAAIVTESHKRRALLTIIALVFFSKMLLAPYYLLEMHPDIPALMCMTWGVISIHKYSRNDSIVPYVFATICFIFAGLFKQNAVAMYIGLGLYLLFTQLIDWKKKIKVLLSGLFAGICVLAVVFSIDGCWLNCVTVNASHPLMSLNVFLSYGINTCKFNKLFLGLVLLFLLQRLFRTSQRDLLKEMYACVALSWFVFCMYGAAKEGANEGNMEAAIIAFMPCVLSFSNQVISFVTNHLSWNGWMQEINRLKWRNVRVVVCVMLIGIISTFLFCRRISNIHRNLEQYHSRIEMQNEFSKWLSNNYSEKNVAYSTINYEVLNNALIHKKTDLYTAYVFRMGGFLSDEDLCDIAEREEWDVIVTPSIKDIAVWPKTFSRFSQIAKDLYPDANVYVFERNKRDK